MREEKQGYYFPTKQRFNVKILPGPRSYPLH
jgi:hypothetical protein